MRGDHTKSCLDKNRSDEKKHKFDSSQLNIQTIASDTEQQIFSKMIQNDPNNF